MNLSNPQDPWLAFGAACALHAVSIFGIGQAFLNRAEFGIDNGSGGVEITLVAEAVPEEPKPLPEPVPEEPLPIPEPAKNDFLIEQPKPVEKKPEEKKEEKPIDKKIEEKKEPPPVQPPKEEGKDKITFHSEKGALTEAKPNYMKNPAPPYPMKARQNGWEGVVILEVIIGRTGHTQSVSVDKSSGYSILDEAAVKAVKKWRFQPARFGDVSIESSVRIPIRFELESRGETLSNQVPSLYESQGQTAANNTS